MERVYYVEGPDGLREPPAPEDGAFACLSEFSRLLVAEVGKTAPLTLADAAECYKGDRRYATYCKARDSLLVQPLEEADAWLKTFVKCEKIDFDKKPDPAPRAIQPRTPRYNLCLGRYLRPMEKALYRGIQRVWGSTTPIVCKGMDVGATGRCVSEKWGEFLRPVAVGLDASRFDQHVSDQALRFEHAIYKQCCHRADRGELSRLLSWQIVNRGMARTSEGIFKYKRTGCRMSGDFNTSLGNCIIMCALVWQYAREKGIRVQLLNNGDDCVVIMEQGDLSKFMDGLEARFLRWGFTMAVERPVYVMEHIEFCQTHPVMVGGQWRMVRNLTCLSKDCCSVLPWGAGRMAYGWATAVGTSGLALNSGVPVYQEFYGCLLRSGCGVHIGHHPSMTGALFQLQPNCKAEAVEVNVDTRVSFWRAFGVDPSMQYILEDMHSTKIVNLDTRGVILQELPVTIDEGSPPLKFIYHGQA